MLFPDMIAYLQERFALEATPQAPQPYITLEVSELVAVCQLLRDRERRQFPINRNVSLGCPEAIVLGKRNECTLVLEHQNRSRQPLRGARAQARVPLLDR